MLVFTHKSFPILATIDESKLIPRKLTLVYSRDKASGKLIPKRSLSAISPTDIWPCCIHQTDWMLQWSWGLLWRWQRTLGNICGTENLKTHRFLFGWWWKAVTFGHFFVYTNCIYMPSITDDAGYGYEAGHYLDSLDGRVCLQHCGVVHPHHWGFEINRAPASLKLIPHFHYTLQFRRFAHSLQVHIIPTMNNSPIYDDHQSQSAKVLFLSREYAHQDNSNYTLQPICEFFSQVPFTVDRDRMRLNPK